MQEKLEGRGGEGWKQGRRKSEFHVVCRMCFSWSLQNALEGVCMTGFCNPHNLEINKINGGELNS